MTSPPLMERLKRARIVQVVLVYLGASWAVLQVADLLQQGLNLPSWVIPVAVILLLIGLVIILATAWVQSLPSTTAREQAGEIPTDWQVAPADAIASLRAGKLPHLTWGRTILGGFVALSAMFGLAGMFVLFTDVRLPIGPEEAGAGEAATGIAVVPFSVSGDDLEVWREGMVDLLATGLDGLGGFRSIDSRTVLARWRSAVGDDTDIDLREALSVAGATGARYAVVGSAVSLGGRVRLSADVYDVSDGSKVGSAQAAEGPPDEVLALADELAVNVIRELLGTRGGDVVSVSQVASLSTSSLEALRSYLLGESLIRHGEFERAASAYEEAVDRDSTFAMAYYRLTSTYGWMEAGGDRAERAELALRGLAENLPPRDRLLLEGEEALATGDVRGVALMEEAAKRYPDDPDAWAMLGELYAHGGERVYGTTLDVQRAFGTAVELDPTFSPNYIHLTEAAMILGRPEEARGLLEAYLRLAPDTHQGRAMSLGYALQYGDESQSGEALAALDTLGLHTSSDLTNGLGPSPRGIAALRAVADVNAERSRGDRWPYTRIWTRVYVGDLEGAERAVPGASTTVRATSASLLRLAGRGTRLQAVTAEDCEASPGCLFHVGLQAVDAGDRGGLARVRGAFQRELARAGESDDAARTSRLRSTRDGLAAYETWRGGDATAAGQSMSEVQARPGAWDVSEWLRLYMGEMAAGEGRLTDVDRILGSLERSPLGWYALVLRARAHAAAGRQDVARELYGGFLELWSEATPEHPLVAEARAASGV